MIAFRLTDDRRAELVDLAAPEMRPGMVRLAVTAAGICHSDLNVIDGLVGRDWSTPFTLGHEIAGVVTEIGSDVDPAWLGKSCAVYAPTGCRECEACKQDQWNYCMQRMPWSEAGLGLGGDGGLAEQLVLDPCRLVPLKSVRPEAAAVLTDAGLTAYHATRLVRNLDSGGPIVVIGIGGLGHLALQFLRHATTRKLIAVDRRPDAAGLAYDCGADLFSLPGEMAEAIETFGDRAAAVVDFVGSDDSLKLSAASLRPDGDLICVGSGGGRLLVGKSEAGLARGGHIHFPSWGSMPELRDVLDLAERGILNPVVTTVDLQDVPAAIESLRAGGVLGRLVATPHGQESKGA